MANKPSSDKPASLDDLLKSNQARFDQIFAEQNKALQILDLRQRPPTQRRSTPDTTEPESAAAPAAVETVTPTDSGALLEVSEADRFAGVSSRETPAVAESAGKLNTLTLDRIENALHHTRQEMLAVLSYSAPSRLLNEQEDTAILSDAKGRMIAGHADAYVTQMLQQQDFARHLQPGDVILQSDPYLCATVNHNKHWLVTLPVFFQDALLGFCSLYAPMADVGGSVPGSTPATATSVFGEGIRIPPLRLYEKGELNQVALDIILNNTRTPQQNHGDLMALIAACRTGEQRMMEICHRFGPRHYLRACEGLLERAQQTMSRLIVQHLPQEPQSFEDYIDDDGCGNGPFRLKLTLWREGDHAYFDWTGTAGQAEGPINFRLDDGKFKILIGTYLASVFYPLDQIPCNSGFYDLIHVNTPQGSLLQPDFPAAFGNYRHTQTRQFEVLGGALCKTEPAAASAAGYGGSARFLYSPRHKGHLSELQENIFGGLPGRPAGDGLDGHSWWPLLQNTPTEVLENNFPVSIEKYKSITDSGGAGLHRGGNGVEKTYLLLENGIVSIHDDRHHTQPWGILGGQAGERSAKWLLKEDGERQPLAAKTDRIKVRGGDRIVFCTAGGGGWGDPLQRDPQKVRNDVARGLVSLAAAREKYGVVLHNEKSQVDINATRDMRDNMKHERKPLPVFDFGQQPAK